MSKLLMAVVHHLDADAVVGALRDEAYRVTRIPSVGGFLELENTTLVLGLEDAQVPAVLELLRRHCSSRDVELPLRLMGRLRDQLPGVVRYGGATVFVLDLDRMIHL